MHKCNTKFLCFYVAIFFHSIAVADDWLYGAGAGMQFLTRGGQFREMNYETLLKVEPESASLRSVGKIMGGFQWKLTPQLALGLESSVERGTTNAKSAIQIHQAENTVKIKTSERDTLTYGLLMQPGVYSNRLKGLLFFNIGRVRSHFDTRYLLSENTLHKKQWKNGWRFGMTHESPATILANAFTRFDILLTHYPPWHLHQQAFFSTEKPVIMQISWGLIWHIDAGNHALSDIVLHHGLFHYLIHPEEWGKEEKDVSQSPF